MRRFLFALLLALQMTAVVNLVNAEIPLPECYPCEESSQR